MSKVVKVVACCCNIAENSHAIKQMQRVNYLNMENTIHVFISNMIVTYGKNIMYQYLF